MRCLLIIVKPTKTEKSDYSHLFQRQSETAPTSSQKRHFTLLTDASSV